MEALGERHEEGPSDPAAPRLTEPIDPPPSPASEVTSEVGRDGLLLALLAAILLLPSLGLDFLCDDWEWLDEMVRIATGRLSQDVRIWTIEVPLASLSKYLDFRLFGYAAWGWHLTSGLIYLATGVAIIGLGRCIGLGRTPALVAAAFFTAHPVHDEVVFWIAARGHLLVTLFIILALLAHRVAWTRTGGRAAVWYVACYAAVVGALLSKEFGLLLVGLMPVFDLLYPIGGWRWRAVILRALPIALLGGGWFLLRGWLIDGDRVQDVAAAQLELPRVGAYLLELFLPVPISFLPEASLLSAGRMALPLFALLASVVAFATIRGGRAGWARLRPTLFPLLLVLLPLGLVATDMLSFRRRYLYLSSLGSALLVGMVVQALRTRQITVAGRVVHIGSLVGLMVVATNLPAFVQREWTWIGAGRYARRMVEPLVDQQSLLAPGGGRLKLFFPVLPYRFGGDDHAGVYVAQEDDLANLFELRCKLPVRTRTGLWAVETQDLTYAATYLSRKLIRVRISQPSAAGMASLIDAIEWLKLPATIDRDAGIIVADYVLPGDDWSVVDLRDGQLRVVERP